MADDRLINAETADQLREGRGEIGQPGPGAADVGSDVEPGIAAGPTTARGNMDARRPLGDDEPTSSGAGAAAASEDAGAPYPAAGLDTDEAQEESPGA